MLGAALCFTHFRLSVPLLQIGPTSSHNPYNTDAHGWTHAFRSVTVSVAELPESSFFGGLCSTRGAYGGFSTPLAHRRLRDLARGFVRSRAWYALLHDSVGTEVPTRWVCFRSGWQKSRVCERSGDLRTLKGYAAAPSNRRGKSCP